jgi:RHS repeat-associated protein
MKYGYDRTRFSYDAACNKFTGKERDSESNLDNFGARYYGSTIARFMTPDWSARPTTVPYAVFGDPQSLNLYTYVRNGPLNRIDADGHGDDDTQFQPYWMRAKGVCATVGYICSNSNNRTQNEKSCGFLCGLGQRVKNGFAGHGFKTNEQLLPKGTVTTTETYSIHEPNPSVTAATDAAGLVAAATKSTPLGVLSAAASVTNDQSKQNVTINMIGLVPGFDAPMAITGAFNDFFDYGINNSNGRIDMGASVVPTTVYDEEGNGMPNPDLDPCGGWPIQAVFWLEWGISRL